jgi:hypothetical protein
MILFPPSGTSLLSPYYMTPPKHIQNAHQYKNSANLYAHLQLIVAGALCIHHPT